MSAPVSITQLLFAGVISLSIIAPGFHAASAEALNADIKKLERKYRKTKTGEGALTRSMLEACIKLKAEIEEEYKKISASKEEFDTLNNKIIDLAASLKENKEKLEDKDEKAVDEHNEQVALYNKKVEELKEMETEYSKKSAPYQKKGAQLEKECNGQPYYEDDYAETVKKTGGIL
jgi:peptidoglycan hydrolase CwlO-like protein